MMTERGQLAQDTWDGIDKRSVLHTHPADGWEVAWSDGEVWPLIMWVVFDDGELTGIAVDGWPTRVDKAWADQLFGEEPIRRYAYRKVAR
ncbi:hypothetical protein [Mycolicibacterium farcinogenes]|uniref:Uncharacterized protein n=1 Tax=Mycolicibacterium farcinogenes TaxID=1802 RepID=A0ACD1F9T2_MYCFR|nr:hypothetical protein [Mycolicibacterium farcinogenes]QZH63806.1 hypothetical protein K6L26_17140 [Mycolicibacterium farcinogenes]